MSTRHCSRGSRAAGLLLAAAALGAIACSKNSDPLGAGAQPSGSALLAEKTEIRVGETRVFGRDELRVTFEAVTNESRCPMDALCVTTGEAATRFAIAPPGAASATRELRTGAPTSVDTAIVGPYSVTLDALLPYPQSGRVVDLPSYTAAISVRRVREP